LKLPRFLKIFLWFLLILTVSLTTFFTILFLGGFGKIPKQTELKNLQQETATLVYSSDGKLIGKYFAQNRTNVEFDSLPKSLVNALIATEDARFYEHEGLDKRSMMRVLFKTLLMGNRSSGGGSTISQQLAKNLFGRKEYGKISILINKLKEIVLAYRIEQVYSKNEIIELYLNTVPFGENVFGIEAAAQRYFNKHSKQLKIEESAILVGLLKANSYYNPRSNPDHAKGRRNVVISQMQKYNYISLAEEDSLQQLPLKLEYANLNKQNPAPYFLNRVRKEAESILSELSSKERKYNLEKDGLIIETTLDLNLHQAAVLSMQEHLQQFQSLLNRQYKGGKWNRELNQLVAKVAKQNGLNLENTSSKMRFLFSWKDSSEYLESTVKDSLNHVLKQLHSGVIGMHPKSGAIKAWVGGINYLHYPYDQVTARRQMASTFKPILYAAALESGANVCEYLSNDAITLEDYENWSPQNYDGESGGKYSLAAALANSKNIPTLHLFFRIDQEQLAKLWDNLGFIDELHQEPSAIYGTNSVSLLELVTAYSSFANLGKSVSPFTIKSIKSASGEVIYEKKADYGKEILSEESCLQLNEILTKAVKEGTGTAMAGRYGVYSEWAGKTGTSQNYSDAWFISYNEELVLASRVGASYPSIHFAAGNYGSGSRLALPIVAKTLQNQSDKAWYNAGISHSDLIDCEDYQEERGIDKVLDVFRKKETTLEKAQDKAKKKEKRKGFFKKLFGK
jgi:penicillin-binding protein 1A